MPDRPANLLDGLVAPVAEAWTRSSRTAPDRRTDDERLRSHAGYVIRLALTPALWVHRRVLKLSPDAAHQMPRSLCHWEHRTASSFGLVARQEVFGELLVGLGASYHAEVVPPADTYAAETTLDPLSGPPVTDRPLHRYRPHLRVTPSALS